MATSTAADRLFTLLRKEPIDAAEVAAFLDGLSPADRMTAVTALDGPVLQGRLWDAVQSTPTVQLSDLVPPDAPPLREVIWEGKNSLPMFSRFQKRFCRPSRVHDQDQLWGYNHQTLSWLTGPGYFVCHREGAAPAAIDYRRVPPEHPPGWPGIRENHRGASFFVYRNMVDYLRRVSRHVLIGRATRQGKELPNYFLLCREG